MGDALITIGITCFREGDWLAECWESVLAQTDDRWVALIVLDGEHDRRTREVFDLIQHPKLRKFVMPENGGPYPARNKAFELTETPYHFYLDGDDALTRDSVALVLDTFERHPDAGFVYGDYVCTGGAEELWTHPHEVNADDLAEAQPTPGPCAYKHELWAQLGGFPEELARGNGDYDLLIGAFEAGVTGRHCGKTFYRYRLGHATKVSHSYNHRYHETHEIMVRRHPLFFSDNRRRHRFLALGYRRAALANAVDGDSKAAARLAWAACQHGLWKDRHMQMLVLKGGLPPWAYRMLRQAWRLGTLARERST